MPAHGVTGAVVSTWWQVDVDPFAVPVTAGEKRTKYAEAMYPYTAEDEGELELAVGDGVWVTKEDLSGWWYGRNVRTGRDGWLPCAYVQPMHPPQQWNDSQWVGGDAMAYQAWSDRSSDHEGSDDIH